MKSLPLFVLSAVLVGCSPIVLQIDGGTGGSTATGGGSVAGGGSANGGGSAATGGGSVGGGSANGGGSATGGGSPSDAGFPAGYCPSLAAPTAREIDPICPAQLPLPGGTILEGTYVLTQQILGGTLAIQPDGGCGVGRGYAGLAVRFTPTANSKVVLFEVAPRAPNPSQSGVAFISESGRAITFGSSTCDGGRSFTPGVPWFFVATSTSFELDQRRTELPDGGGLDIIDTSFAHFEKQ